MSSLVEYAKSELERAFPSSDDYIQEHAKKDILELIETFSNQNHSGMNANYVLRLFYRLVRGLPILPLTGEDDEWGKPFGINNTQQNKRCSKIFRDNFDNGTAHDIKGKVFIDSEGCGYTNRDSSVPIAFPYEVPDEPEYVRID